MNFFTPLLNLLDNLSFFILAQLVAITITICAGILLCTKKLSEQLFLPQIKPILIVILLAAISEDIAWLVDTLKTTVFTQIDLRIIVLIIRIAWIFSIVQYQAFGFFIEALTPNKTMFLFIVNRITLFFSIGYCLIFTWLILFKTYCLERAAIEIALFHQISCIYMPILILIYLISTLITLSDRKTPNSIRSLIYTFIVGLIGPTILVDIIHIYKPSIIFKYFQYQQIMIALLSIFIASTTYWCIKRILLLDSDQIKQPDCLNQ